MSIVKIKLVEKRSEAEGTESFIWEPEGDISYLPGQYYYFTLPKLDFPDSRGSTRHFTLSSSPTERKTIMFTTRVRKESGFKQTLDGLSIGTIIEGEGPNGTFILDEHEKGSHVFLAGGIGITPFRSMLKYKFDKNIDAPIHLIYSNSTQDQITFRKELERWDGKLNFRLSLTVTKPEESKEKWSGLVGRIDDSLVSKLVSDLTKSTFWVVGPPPMVSAVEEVLEKLGVPQDHIRSEKFIGY